MRLSALLEGAEARVAAGPPEAEIRGLCADSRSCRSGFLFAAFPGLLADGRRFAGAAVRNGAIAVLAGEDGIDRRSLGAATLLAAAKPRRSFALLCARFHRQRPPVAVAVTGTNGKSSTVEFCRQFWQARGVAGASIGTLGAAGPEGTAPLAHTTPDPLVLHRQLETLARAGARRVAIEASSHGLHQHRLDGMSLRAAGFTNLTQDHADYHRDREAYLAAKARLFDLVETGGSAVLNADAEAFDTLAERCRARRLRIVSYGRSGADLRLLARQQAAGGQRLRIACGGRSVTVDLPLAGRFQAMNALCAAAMVAAAEDCEAADILALTGALRGVPGRLEAVPGHPAGARVFVDYAHTPDALANVLGALRDDMARGTRCRHGEAGGRLVVVFGCGGERDRSKRAPMGGIAARLADDVIVTDDNPRGEDAAAIRRQILAAAPAAREIGDRRLAIRQAVASLAEGDVLVVAGKGHETGQTVGAATLPFDDAREVARAIASLEAGR